MKVGPSQNASHLEPIADLGGDVGEPGRGNVAREPEPVGLLIVHAPLAGQHACTPASRSLRVAPMSRLCA